jgi:hypothetical protein
MWGYFARSVTQPRVSVVSGAVPNEKITWGKLSTDHAQIVYRERRDDSGTAYVALVLER